MKPVDLLPVCLAIVCYVLAAVFKDNQGVVVAFMGIGGTLTGLALPQLSALSRRVTDKTP